MRARPGWFGQPYPMGEALRWVANNLWGPRQTHARLTTWLADGTVLEPIVPKLRIAFVGDIMPFAGRRFRPAP